VVQQSPKKANAVIKFIESKHNFGKIKIGVPVTCDFVFKNVGNKPVVIEYAKASCGCTKPGWPEAPVAKAKEGTISAGFNAAAAGAFAKTIFVKVAGYAELVELKITGEVLSANEYAKYKATQQQATEKTIATANRLTIFNL
jgi:hypothetical protein